MKTKVQGGYRTVDAALYDITGRCPGCSQKVRYEPVMPSDLVSTSDASQRFAQRRCPDMTCGQHLFFVANGKDTFAFPAETLDFDPAGIPQPIVESLSEAIKCHAAECYKAAALMIRRTLEELCKDRGATGANLKKRLESLKTKIIVPPELLSALDDLRLLGNDAAHLESQVYDKISKDEVEIAFDFTKEVLKSVYQYAQLLSRLQSLKKQPQP